MTELTHIHWYDSIDSTNSEARRLISDIDNLSVIAAGFQTQGRGQGDHKWHSKEGENLTFSLVLKYQDIAPLKAEEQLYITQIITYALRAFLSAHGINSRIKWPNDIYVEDKKICGILIENMLNGEYVEASIIGVGLNLNQKQFPEDLPNPISISLLTKKEYSPEQMLAELYHYMEESVNLLKTEEGREKLKSEFDAHVFRLSA